jgi:hypothetical protein
MKYKVGDILEVASEHEHECYTFKNRGESKYVKITEVRSGGYVYDILDKDKEVIGACSSCFNDVDLKVRGNRGWEDALVGDIVMNGEQKWAVVLAVCGMAYGLSIDADDLDFDSWYSLSEVKENGWTIKGDTQGVVEVTMDEIADKMGIDVAQLKIKKQK